MKWRVLLAAILAMAAGPTYAAWTFVAAGALASGGGTLTTGLPAGHTSGDHLIWIGLSRNSANAVAIPSGYAEVYSITAAAKFFVIADKIDGGSESAPSTAANGTSLAQLFAYRGGPSSLTGLLHASATAGSVQCTTNPPIPALTITQNNTLVLGIAFQLDNYTGFTSNPSGFTTADHNAYDGSSDLSLMVAHQIQTTATNIGAGNFTTAGATQQTCNGVTISLTAGATTGGSVSITSVNTTNSIAYTDTNRVATVANAGATQSTSTFKLVDQGGSVKSTQSIDTWSATSIQFDPTQGNVRFGTVSYELVVGANTATLPGTLTVPSGEWYSDISGIVSLDFNTDGSKAYRLRYQPNRYYDSPTDLANGDQLHCKRTGGSGTLTLNGDGTFQAPPTITQIQCRKWHSGTWGSFQTWDLTGGKPVFTGPHP